MPQAQSQAPLHWKTVEVTQMDTLIPDFGKLSTLEQKAVRLAITGLRDWSQTKEESKPIRVEIGLDVPFRVKRVAGILHQVGIDIASTLIQERGFAIFQPTPSNEDERIELGLGSKIDDILSGLDGTDFDEVMKRFSGGQGDFPMRRR